MINDGRVIRILRSILITGGTLALIYFGVNGANSVLAGLLVIVGAIAIGMWLAKQVWPEPKP